MGRLKIKLQQCQRNNQYIDCKHGYVIYSGRVAPSRGDFFCFFFLY